MVENWRADLHTHSTSSDGSLSPQELVQAALAADLQGLSITDHDSVEAYALLGWEQLPRLEGQMARSKDGLILLPGVEMTSQLDGESVHILAFGFDPLHPLILQTCDQRKVDRRERYFEMRQKLRKCGVPISAEIELPDRILGRPQLAHELVSLGVCRSFQEAFRRYLSDEAPAYVPGKAYPTEEAIELLRSTGAKVILAHPMILKPVVCEKALKLPFDGLEAFYGRHHHLAARWVAAAQERGWLATGGSDFHGASRPDISLGASWTPLETFERLAASS